MDAVFNVSSLLVAPFWVAMILLPRWRGTQILMRHPIGTLILGLVYLGLVVPLIPAVLPGLLRPALSEWQVILATPKGTTLAWVHFMAFDLLIGRWIYFDARARGLFPVLTSLILLLTVLLGPLGWLAYAGVRATQTVSVWPRLRTLLQQIPDGAQPLLGLASATVGVLAISLWLQLWDSRQLLGVSTWTKPAKFALSMAFTSATLAVVLGAMTPLSRGMRFAIRSIVGLIAVEFAAIGIQATRAVPSHFNYRAPFDRVLLAIMGVSIILVWLAFAYLAWRAFRHRFADATIGWGIRFGFLIFLFGTALGGFMVTPTPEQRSSFRRKEPPAAIGAHTVGAPDGGAGLPVAGWSRDAGDLRVAHFVGIHGWQVLPLFGVWLSRRRRTRQALVSGSGVERASRRTILVVGASYVGFTTLVLVQALRGQSLLAPDGLTWATFGLWLAATIGALLGVTGPLWRPRDKRAAFGVVREDQVHTTTRLMAPAGPSFEACGGSSQREK